MADLAATSIAGGRTGGARRRLIRATRSASRGPLHVGNRDRVVRGLPNGVPVAPKRCARFVASLGEAIVSRGHTLMTGCRGSLDQAIAGAAHAFVTKTGGSPAQIVSFLPRKAQPVHRFGVINRSYVANWEDISRPDATPPEQAGRRRNRKKSKGSRPRQVDGFG